MFVLSAFNSTLAGLSLKITQLYAKLDALLVMKFIEMSIYLYLNSMLEHSVYIQKTYALSLNASLITKTYKMNYLPFTFTFYVNERKMDSTWLVTFQKRKKT